MSAAEHEAAIGRLLAELGDTADKVADALRAKGIKGRKAKAASCPIANYVNASSDYEHATASDILVTADDPDDEYHSLRVTTPQPVRQFIGNFDDGVYLDLVEVP